MQPMHTLIKMDTDLDAGLAASFDITDERKMEIADYLALACFTHIEEGPGKVFEASKGMFPDPTELVYAAVIMPGVWRRAQKIYRRVGKALGPMFVYKNWWALAEKIIHTIREDVQL